MQTRPPHKLLLLPSGLPEKTAARFGVQPADRGCRPDCYSDSNRLEWRVGGVSPAEESGLSVGGGCPRHRSRHSPALLSGNDWMRRVETDLPSGTHKVKPNKGKEHQPIPNAAFFPFPLFCLSHSDTERCHCSS